MRLKTKFLGIPGKPNRIFFPSNEKRQKKKAKQKLTSILITEVKDNGLIIVSYHEIITLPDGRIYVGWTDCRFVVWIWSKGGRQKIQSRRGQVGIHFCARFQGATIP